MNRKADQAWLLAMLSTYAPDDEIFKCDYRPPSKIRQVAEKQKVDNRDGLFDILAVLPAKSLKKKGRNLFSP